jgi:hypothetical protein
MGSAKDGLEKEQFLVRRRSRSGAMSTMGIFHQWIQRNLSDSARSREKRLSESGEGEERADAS